MFVFYARCTFEFHDEQCSCSLPKHIQILFVNFFVMKVFVINDQNSVYPKSLECQGLQNLEAFVSKKSQNYYVYIIMCPYTNMGYRLCGGKDSCVGLIIACT